MSYVIAIALLRMIFGRGEDVWPKDIKAICLSLMLLLTFFENGSWTALQFLLLSAGIILYCKLPARNRYVAMTEEDKRSYEKDWLRICWLTDKILGTKSNSLLSSNELIRWGCVCAALQGLFSGLIITFAASDLSVLGLVIGSVGALQGVALFLARFAPEKERYGGVMFDTLSGLLLAALIKLAIFI